MIIGSGNKLKVMKTFKRIPDGKKNRYPYTPDHYFYVEGIDGELVKMLDIHGGRDFTMSVDELKQMKKEGWLKWIKQWLWFAGVHSM